MAGLLFSEMNADNLRRLGAEFSRRSPVDQCRSIQPVIRSLAVTGVRPVWYYLNVVSQSGTLIAARRRLWDF
jgi:hypothetical protein